MSLELIVGPMFAGKSSYILSEIRRYSAIGWPILSVTCDLDTRYGTHAIYSHNKESHPAVAVKKLMDTVGTADYQKAKLVIIEESQFFTDLVEYTLFTVEQAKKRVIVVGLDGDSERRPFGHILELIPFCDKITKVTSLCKLCGDGTPALFSHRKTDEQAIVSVGAAEQYEAVCRKHYLEKKNMNKVPAIDHQRDLNVGC